MRTTLREAAFRRRLSMAKIGKQAELDPRTIAKMFDEIPDSVSVGNIRQAAEALGLRLVILLDDPLADHPAEPTEG